MRLRADCLLGTHYFPDVAALAAEFPSWRVLVRAARPIRRPGVYILFARNGSNRTYNYTIRAEFRLRDMDHQGLSGVRDQMRLANARNRPEPCSAGLTLTRLRALRDAEAH